MNRKRIKNRLGLAFSGILNFLFPANESVAEFERVSAEDLLRLLPKSEPVDPPHGTSKSTITTLFAYRDEKVKHLVWEIKYYRNQRLTEVVGKLMAEKTQEKIKSGSQLEEKYFLVPIPLTNRRLRERGYNHTELLAKAIIKHLPKDFVLSTEFLKKIRHTPKQQSVEDRYERFINIAGAFIVPSTEDVRGKHILIIDDVVTTGATVTEATRALYSAGASTVQICAIAH